MTCASIVRPFGGATSPLAEGEEYGSDGIVPGPRAWQRRGRQAAGLAPGALRAPRRGRRAPLGRWVLPEHRLPAEQERNLECESRRLVTPCHAVWERHGPRHGGYGPGA